MIIYISSGLLNIGEKHTSTCLFQADQISYHLLLTAPLPETATISATDGLGNAIVSG